MNITQNSVNVPLERRVDLMIEKEKIKEERLEIKREIQQIQEVSECSFKPKIIRKKTSPERQSQPIHERLFKLRKEKPTYLKDQPKLTKKEEEELKECSFQPKINQIRHGSHQKYKSVDKPPCFKTYSNRNTNTARPKTRVEKNVAGYSNTVNRMRRANHEKDLIQEKKEK